MRRRPFKRKEENMITRRYTGIGMATFDMVSTSMTHEEEYLICLYYVGLSARNRDDEIIRILLTDSINQDDATKLW